MKCSKCGIKKTEAKSGFYCGYAACEEKYFHAWVREKVVLKKCTNCQLYTRFLFQTNIDYGDRKIAKRENWCKKCIKKHNGNIEAFVTIQRASNIEPIDYGMED